MFSLVDQPLLFVDCQTTGATPATAHLLEVGWTIGRASDQSPSPVITRLVALPEGETVPRHIQRLTGISEEEMTGALPPQVVAEELQNQLLQHDLQFACAHWAQFEKLFLEDCFQTHTAQKQLPLEFICTCQIAKRLYPDLPSRAIRALGGYLGFSLEEMKRSHGHVETTYFIWQKLARQLDDLGIKNVAQLSDWLSIGAEKSAKRLAKRSAKRSTRIQKIDSDYDSSKELSKDSSNDSLTNSSKEPLKDSSKDSSTNSSTNSSKGPKSKPKKESTKKPTNELTNESADKSTNQSTDKSTNQSTDKSTNQSTDKSTNEPIRNSSSVFLLPLERLTRLELPPQPGVYRMLNAQGKILYVGKATNLKSRVNSYFTGRKGKASKTKELISQVFDLKVSVVPTPLEAALLENDLIKAHDPPYNRALKKRGRSLVYFSRDFSSSCGQYDEKHPLGPFPRGSTVEPLILLVQGWHSQTFDPGLFWGLLDQDATNRAVTLFISQYLDLEEGEESQQPRLTVNPSKDISVRKLLALGLSFYRRELLDWISANEEDLALTYFLGRKAPEAEDAEADLIDGQEGGQAGEGGQGGEPGKDKSAAAKANADAEASVSAIANASAIAIASASAIASANANAQEPDEDDSESEEYTDEDLLGMVFGLIIGAARSYMMSRKMIRLFNARISFEDKKRLRGLVFVDGSLTHSEDISHSLVAEGGTAWRSRPPIRGDSAAIVDIATYDRMRVLLAEIRRIYFRGQWISIS